MPLKSYIVLTLALPFCLVYGLLLNVFRFAVFLVRARKLSHIPRSKYSQWAWFFFPDCFHKMMQDDLCKHDILPPVTFAGYFTEGNPAVFVNGLQELQELGDDRLFPKWYRAYEDITVILNRGIVSATTAAEWEKYRGILDPVFYVPHLATIAKNITAETNVLVRYISSHNNQPTDVLKLAGDSIMRIFVDCFYGGLLSAEKINSLFMEANGKFLQYGACMHLLGKTLGENLPWPWIKTLHEFNEEMSKDMEFLLQSANEESPKNPDNVLNVLLNSELTRDEAKAEAQGFLTGYTAVIVTLVWCIYYLARYPEEAKKLQQEVDLVLGNSAPSTAHMPKLRNCKAFMMEVVRLQPAAPVSYRIAAKSCNLGGYLIPEGTLLIMNLAAPMLHQQYVEAPFEFRPQRFLDENKKPIAITTFSVGRRNCIGQNFAKMVIPLLLAAIVSLPPKYDKELPPRFHGVWGIDELFCHFTARN